MKHTTILTLTLLATALLAGCLGDGTDNDETDGSGDDLRAREPRADPGPGDAGALVHVARLLAADDEPVAGSGGIWLHNDLAYGSGIGRGGTGFWIADVHDPMAPVLLYASGEDSETPFSRDADIVDHGDGRVTLVLATQSDGMHVWDVTDPADPRFAANVDVNPNHNIAVIPGTTLVFNSQSGGAGTTNDLVDVSDPYAPVVLGTYGTHGCHDIAFYGDASSDKFRAYCAGIDRTEIWNLDGFDASASDFGITLVATIEGADSPVVGNPVFGSYPIRTLHHLSIVNDDATLLVVGDEHNGGGAPGTCLAYDPVTGLSTPFGALWFYDISDETAPELLGWFSPPFEGAGPNPDNPPAVTPNCTAHFGTFIPGTDRLVMAWYSAGTILLDVSNPASPSIIATHDPDDGNVWEARYYKGYVFTGDILRGMDVLAFE